MTAAEAVHDVAARLRAAGIDSDRLDARLLVAHVLGVASHRMVTHGETVLDAAAAERLEALVRRREAREPVSHLLGEREFWSLPFRVTAATLTPRPDSETLIDAALAHVDRTAPLRVLDVGTGTGCLLLALLSELPHASGVGTDVSAAALAVARDNAHLLDNANRARFVESAWAHGVVGPFDLIVSNPPYIASSEIAGLEPEVARYEPRVALDGGADGLDAYRALGKHLPPLLARRGTVVLENGAGQEDEVRRLMAPTGLRFVEWQCDLGGWPRALVFAGNGES